MTPQIGKVYDVLGQGPMLCTGVSPGRAGKTLWRFTSHGSLWTHHAGVTEVLQEADKALVEKYEQGAKRSCGKADCWCRYMP